MNIRIVAPETALSPKGIRPRYPYRRSEPGGWVQLRACAVVATENLCVRGVAFQQPEPTTMALQSAPEKLKRLNWRERWWFWPSRPQQTGSEYPDKPVLCETGSNSDAYPQLCHE